MPSDRVLFLTLEEVLAIHETLIQRFGGSPGVRDHGLLESALYRPQTGYYADLFEMAAAMMESLLMNHPFTDGNKRVAFFATDVFLRFNGWKLDIDQHKAYRFIVGGLEAGSSDFEALRKWITRNVDQLSLW